MHPWVTQVEQALLPIADKTIASQMKAYLRGQFHFYGIKAGPRREAVKPLFSTTTRPALQEIPAVVDQLWACDEREFQMVGIDLLMKVKKQLPPTVLPDVERWITTNSWWDTVDMLATHTVGSLYQQHPQATDKFIQHWRTSENIWLRRTTLLFQLKYKNKTDVDLLFNLIRENQSDNEFFIQKAIGWVLREYSKTDAQAVTQFIDQQNIQGLARREGLKWLNNH